MAPMSRPPHFGGDRAPWNPSTTPRGDGVPPASGRPPGPARRRHGGPHRVPCDAVRGAAHHHQHPRAPGPPTGPGPRLWAIHVGGDLGLRTFSWVRSSPPPPVPLHRWQDVDHPPGKQPLKRRGQNTGSDPGLPTPPTLHHGPASHVLHLPPCLHRGNPPHTATWRRPPGFLCPPVPGACDPAPPPGPWPWPQHSVPTTVRKGPGRAGECVGHCDGGHARPPPP